ncbi:MAG: NAD(P)/FAD-dependent oxidoreductase, partial [Lachnospiraceae bacterium]|nr:NAD(P)/FAD-dependent oxidoreductase [Lachnospiraceae bacterium]
QIYVVGELLDVDGICGGYNLHWAWISGIGAARSAVRNKIMEESHASTDTGEASSDIF